MSPELILELGQSAIITLLKVIAPIMAVSLVVGLIIALFQALTSIQEMTLTFVPKILLVFLALMLGLPWMSDQLYALSMQLFDHIVSVGKPEVIF